MPQEIASIFVTGANGFLGRALVTRISSKSIPVLAGVRTEARAEEWEGKPHVRAVVTGALNSEADIGKPLSQCATVVHCAARVHVMDEASTHPLAEFRAVNVEGTLKLARQAAAADVRRFVFISSIKVNGEHTDNRPPFATDDFSAPLDPYGISKMEAEQGLQRLADETGMEVVIIRPPLVYGPGVKGNFASMIKLVEKGLPLPFGAVHNKRSLVALDNLVDLILTCVDHPAAANQVFLAGDGEDLSTTELLQRVGTAIGKPARLIPIPGGLLMLGAALLGKKSVAQRLLGSLQVDISKTRELLGWNPPSSVDEGLRRCFAEPDLSPPHTPARDAGAN